MGLWTEMNNLRDTYDGLRIEMAQREVSSLTPLLLGYLNG